VSLSGQISDTVDSGGGITVLSNSGGSTTLGNSAKKLDTGSADAVLFNNSDGHTLTLSGGGLDIDTTTGRGVEAGSSGTLNVAGSGNTIDTGSGRALNVTNTDVGPGEPLTFQRISSNGAPAGIQLSNTGPNLALTVTGDGGACTNANTSGCTGGRIQNSTGADDAGATPSGSGLVLNSTRGVSLTRMHIHDHSNYGIRGTSVVDFTLADSVVNGTNGTSGVNDDSSVYFDNAAGPALTGSASITDTHIQGGFENNFWVSQTAGALNRITFDDVTIGANSTTGGNAGIMLEGLGTTTMNATVNSSDFTSTRATHFQMIAGGSGGGDLDFTNNTISNNHPAVGTGGGGILFQGGAGGGTFDLNVNGTNTIRDSLGHAVIVEKNIGAGSITGLINNLTVGVDGTANSGSLEGDGLKVEHEGGGNLTLAITNNSIRGYNNFGMELKAGDGIVQTGTMNLTVTGNLVEDPGANLAGVFQGILLNNGVTPGDDFDTCLHLKNNAAVGAGKNGGTDLRVRSRQSGSVRLPGYAGNLTDTTAIATFLANQNDANGNDPGANPPVPSSSAVLDPGASFSGTGVTCP
jgi:hypothetical protein